MQTSVSLDRYTAFQTWNHGKMLAYIADVSWLTNRSFYMRTLSLISFSLFKRSMHRALFRKK